MLLYLKTCDHTNIFIAFLKKFSYDTFSFVSASCVSFKGQSSLRGPCKYRIHLFVLKHSMSFSLFCNAPVQNTQASQHSGISILSCIIIPPICSNPLVSHCSASAFAFAFSLTVYLLLISRSSLSASPYSPYDRNAATVSFSSILV